MPDYALIDLSNVTPTSDARANIEALGLTDTVAIPGGSPAVVGQLLRVAQQLQPIVPRLLTVSYADDVPELYACPGIADQATAPNVATQLRTLLAQENKEIHLSAGKVYRITSKINVNPRIQVGRGSRLYGHGARIWFDYNDNTNFTQISLREACVVDDVEFYFNMGTAIPPEAWGNYSNESDIEHSTYLQIQRFMNMVAGARLQNCAINSVYQQGNKLFDGTQQIPGNANSGIAGIEQADRCLTIAGDDCVVDNVTFKNWDEVIADNGSRTLFKDTKFYSYATGITSLTSNPMPTHRTIINSTAYSRSPNAIGDPGQGHIVGGRPYMLIINPRSFGSGEHTIYLSAPDNYVDPYDDPNTAVPDLCPGLTIFGDFTKNAGQNIIKLRNHRGFYIGSVAGYDTSYLNAVGTNENGLHMENCRNGTIDGYATNKLSTRGGYTGLYAFMCHDIRINAYFANLIREAIVLKQCSKISGKIHINNTSSGRGIMVDPRWRKADPTWPEQPFIDDPQIDLELELKNIQATPVAMLGDSDFTKPYSVRLRGTTDKEGYLWDSTVPSDHVETISAWSSDATYPYKNTVVSYAGQDWISTYEDPDPDAVDGNENLDKQPDVQPTYWRIWEWSASETYIKGQVTPYPVGGPRWLALQDSTNQTPVDGSAYWKRVAMPTKGFDIRLHDIGDPALAPETRRWLNRRSAAIPPTVLRTIDDLVCWSVETGVWSKLGRMVLFGVGERERSGVDLVNPLNSMNIGANVFFDKLYGFTSDGTAGLGFSAAPFQIENYTRDSASFGWIVGTNPEAATGNFDFDAPDVGHASTAGANQIFLGNAKNEAGNFVARINDGVNLTFANADARGVYVVTRTGATERKAFKDGVQMAADNQASNSTGNPASIRLMGTHSLPGVFSPRQLRAFFIGGGLTDGEAIGLSKRLKAFGDAMS
jgi:hypothetical protein